MFKKKRVYGFDTWCQIKRSFTIWKNCKKKNGSYENVRKQAEVDLNWSHWDIKIVSIISEGTLEVWTNQHLTLKNSFENITDQSVYSAP